jgi:hypothetical protein
LLLPLLLIDHRDVVVSRLESIILNGGNRRRLINRAIQASTQINLGWLKWFVHRDDAAGNNLRLTAFHRRDDDFIRIILIWRRVIHELHAGVRRVRRWKLLWKTGADVVEDGLTVIRIGLILRQANRLGTILNHFLYTNFRAGAPRILQGKRLLGPTLLNTRPLTQLLTDIVITVQVQVRVLLDALVHRREHESARVLNLNTCHIIGVRICNMYVFSAAGNHRTDLA